MNKYLDKVTIFILCAVFYVRYTSSVQPTDMYLVVPVIGAVIAGALMSYIEHDGVKLAVLLCYTAVSCLDSGFCFFLPVIFYDIFFTPYRLVVFSAVAPLALGYNLKGEGLMALVVIALFSGLSLLVRRRTRLLDKLRSEYIALRDSAKELSMRLERKNKELLEKQDYEIRLATLDERNRIARDIHDNVGHILTNAILQTGAMLATTADDNEKARLQTLRDTLTAGMDSIRNSIHGLHDESLDLYAELQRLKDGFDFCPVTLDYDVAGNLDRQIKYALIAIVKEALSNIIRHSDATLCSITMREHPGLYQMIVRDNGRKKSDPEEGAGIGLENIRQRVESLGGLVNISSDNGFTVFVSIPKTHREAV